MELRYVYRKIEDAIGAPLDIQESLHSELTRRIRHAFREAKDIAHHMEMTALCLAAMSGNKNIDVASMSSKIAGALDESLCQAVPYMKDAINKHSETPRKSDYELAFEELEEFTKELNEGKAKGFLSAE